MRPWVPFKIIASAHECAIPPGHRYFAIIVRLVETEHRLPQFLELLRPGCGLANHDQLGTHRLSLWVPTACRQGAFVAV
jgi:hypothetical protein